MDEKICARRAQEVHREVTVAVMAFDAEAFSTVGQKRTEAAGRLGRQGEGLRQAPESSQVENLGVRQIADSRMDAGEWRQARASAEATAETASR